jgi:polysaccharide export outer membrane protein
MIHPRRVALLTSCLLAPCLVAASGCATLPPYVWVDELAQGQPVDDYVVGVGDLLSIRVLNQDNLSTNARVRSDGKIAVPLLGDVDVRGKQPTLVSRELEGRFKRFVVAPSVTVTVEMSQTTTISVLGEVGHAGIYSVAPQSGVLEGIAVAGGFTDYASRDAIYVVRPTQSHRIRFRYESLLRGEGLAATFRLRTGDVLVVE